MDKRELSNDELNDISSGFFGVVDCYRGDSIGDSVSVSQEEYNALNEGHFLTGGKLKNVDIIGVANYLAGKGFEGCLCSSGSISNIPGIRLTIEN